MKITKNNQKKKKTQTIYYLLYKFANINSLQTKKKEDENVSFLLLIT